MDEYASLLDSRKSTNDLAVKFGSLYTGNSVSPDGTFFAEVPAARKLLFMP
jgi:hypothetical protein